MSPALSNCLRAVKPVVLYDADCGFCRWSLEWVVKWDRNDSLEYLPIQSDEGCRLLAAVPEGARLDSWHLVEPDGTVFSAGLAFPPLLRRLPRGRRLARLSELMPGVSEAGYRLVAANRGRLGGLVRRFGEVPPTRFS